MSETKWQKVCYWIADTFFNKQLDEAFEMGQRSGSDYALSKTWHDLEVNVGKNKLSPAAKRGYEQAQRSADQSKLFVRNKFGISR